MLPKNKTSGIRNRIDNNNLRHGPNDASFENLGLMKYFHQITALVVLW